MTCEALELLIRLFLGGDEVYFGDDSKMLKESPAGLQETHSSGPLRIVFLSSSIPAPHCHESNESSKDKGSNW